MLRVIGKFIEGLMALCLIVIILAIGLSLALIGYGIIAALAQYALAGFGVDVAFWAVFAGVVAIWLVVRA